MLQRHTRPLSSTGRLSLLTLLVIQVGACSVFKNEDEVADEARVVITGTVTEATQLITSTRFERWYDDQGEAHSTLLVADTIFLLDHMEGGASFDEIYPVKPDIGFLARVVHNDDVPAVISMKVYFDGELSYDQRDVSLSQSSIEFSYIFSNFNTLY
jgi:hypothetical protein